MCWPCWRQMSRRERCGRHARPPRAIPPFTFGAVMLIRELTLLNASTLPLALLQVIVAVLQRQEHSVSCHSSAEFDEVDGARCSC